MEPYQVVIRGIRVNPWLKAGSLNLSSVMGSRSVGSAILNSGSQFVPQKGDQVRIYDPENTESYTKDGCVYDGSEVHYMSPFTSPSKGSCRVRFYWAGTVNGRLVFFGGSPGARGTPNISIAGTTITFMWYNSSSGSYITSGGTPCAVGYHEAVFNWDVSTKRFECYLDGGLVYANTFSVMDAPYSGGYAYMAGDNTGDDISATIFSFQMYNRWLTANDVKKLYDGLPYEPSDPTLVIDLDYTEATSGNITNKVDGSTWLATGLPHTWTTHDYDRYVAVFSGVIFERRRKIPLGKTTMDYTLTLVDNAFYCDRKYVYAHYKDTTTRAIVQDLIAQYLDPYDIAEGTIATGSKVEAITWNGKSVTDCLNELADMDGYTWRVDDNKLLHYGPYTDYVAPWNISDANGYYIELEVADSLADYVNYQIIQGSTVARSDIREDQWDAVAGQRSYLMELPILSVTSLTVNGVTKTLGIRGVDTGKDWYWSEGDRMLTIDDAGTPPTAGYRFVFKYVGSYPLQTYLRDEAEIAVRASAEVNDGIYQNILDDTALQNFDLGISKIRANLAQNGYDVADIEYSTYKSGLRAGMNQTIVRSDYDLDTTILLTEVKANQLPNIETMKWTVRGVIGTKRDSWLDYFKKLIRQANYEIRAKEEVRLMSTINANVYLSDSTTVGYT